MAVAIAAMMGAAGVSTTPQAHAWWWENITASGNLSVEQLGSLAVCGDPGWSATIHSVFNDAESDEACGPLYLADLLATHMEQGHRRVWVDTLRGSDQSLHVKRVASLAMVVGGHGSKAHSLFLRQNASDPQRSELAWRLLNEEVIWRGLDPLFASELGELAPPFSLNLTCSRLSWMATFKPTSQTDIACDQSDWYERDDSPWSLSPLRSDTGASSALFWLTAMRDWSEGEPAWLLESRPDSTTVFAADPAAVFLGRATPWMTAWTLQLVAEVSVRSGPTLTWPGATLPLGCSASDAPEGWPADAVWAQALVESAAESASRGHASRAAELQWWAHSIDPVGVPAVQQVSPVGVGFKIGELVHTKSVGPEGAEAARAKQAIALDACGWPDPLAVWRCIESCAQKTKK